MLAANTVTYGTQERSRRERDAVCDAFTFGQEDSVQKLSKRSATTSHHSATQPTDNQLEKQDKYTKST